MLIALVTEKMCSFVRSFGEDERERRKSKKGKGGGKKAGGKTNMRGDHVGRDLKGTGGEKNRKGKEKRKKEDWSEPS